MLTQTEFKLLKKSITHMQAMWFSDPAKGGVNSEFVKKESIIDLIEEFVQHEGRVDLTVHNFASEFKKALSEHEEEQRKRS